LYDILSNDREANAAILEKIETDQSDLANDPCQIFTANVGTASVPSQIHQLAAVLWDILNNDRDSNAAILEKLENPGEYLRTNPVQVFTATDLAHLASHLALTTHVLSQQAQNMEELSEIDD